jgi:primosomal replication protein N
MLRVSLLGHLGADPELRYSPNGSPIVSFRVAVNLVRNGPDGERRESAEWFRVTVMGRQTEYAQRLTKGARCSWPGASTPATTSRATGSSGSASTSGPTSSRTCRPARAATHPSPTTATIRPRTRDRAATRTRPRRARPVHRPLALSNRRRTPMTTNFPSEPAVRGCDPRRIVDASFGTGLGVAPWTRDIRLGRVRSSEERHG